MSNARSRAVETSAPRRVQEQVLISGRWGMAALTLLVGTCGCLEPADEWRLRRERYPDAYIPDEALNEVCGDPEQNPLQLSPYVSELSRQAPYVDARGNGHGQYTMFESAASVLASVAGTWVLCEARQAPSQVGVQLMSDGRWRELTLQAGQLIAGAGFGREGPLRAVESTEALRRAFPGSYQLLLLPYGLGVASEVEATRTIDDAPLASPSFLEIDSGSYLPGQLPVLEPEAVYTDGERAGVDGCGASERGIVATAAEAAALLSGDFVSCSGMLRDGPAQLHFEGSAVELRRDDGSVLAGSVSFTKIESGLLTIQFPRQTLSGRTWQVVLSRAPLKLWIVEVAGQVAWSSSLADRVIFSALP